MLTKPLETLSEVTGKLIAKVEGALGRKEDQAGVTRTESVEIPDIIITPPSPMVPTVRSFGERSP